MEGEQEQPIENNDGAEEQQPPPVEG